MLDIFRSRSFGNVFVMSTLLLSFLGLSMGGYQDCAFWREIAPCTCKLDTSRDNNSNTEIKKVSINCEQMESFGEIVDRLKNRFQPDYRITLRIAYSNLDDFGERSFKEMNMTIGNLNLNHNDLSELSPYTFSGLTHVKYLNLADNPIPYMPIEVFEMMPNIKTLDLGRLRLKNLPQESFRSLGLLETVVLPSNILYRLDTHAIPPTVKKLHLARNSIRDLNGTLRHLSELQWLFLNSNELTTLDDQLPRNSPNLKMLHVANNRIQKLPQEIKTFTNLDNLFFQYNLLTGLDKALSKSRKLDRAILTSNRISTLLQDDFAEAENLQYLELQNNYISNLNGSLLPLRKLSELKLNNNLLREFSWQEIRGLQNLKILELSYNKIRHITGLMPNLIEWEIKLTRLDLDHNELHSLNGAVSGLHSLLRLNLSFNKLTKISPDDLIGLDQLTMLDVSHNQLTTLEETSKTFLPALEELIASNNYLRSLDKDFHGLPVLCWAFLANNQIDSLGKDLVSKTQCRLRDGLHTDEWGVLTIDLNNNPIMCDSILPEIIANMEIHHANITGSTSNCPPATVKPIIPINEPIYNTVQTSGLNERNLQDLTFNRQPIHQEQFVPIREHQNIRHNHGIQYQSIMKPLPYQTFKSEPLHVRLNTNLPITDDQQIIPNDPYKRSSDDAIKINDSNLTPINENQVLTHSDSFKRSSQSKLGVTELPLNDQPIYTNIDPIVQEQQISQLASEIEQLRSRVQELTSENQRLAENLHKVEKTFEAPKPGPLSSTLQPNEETTSS